MPTFAGPKEPNVGSQDDSGEDWDNPNKIAVGVAGNPTVVLGHHDESSVLIATDFRFAVSGTIAGIEVSFIATSSGAGGTSHIVCNHLILTNNGTSQPAIGCISLADDDPIGTIATTVTKGGPTNTWGRTWAPAEICGDEFGVVLRLENFDGSVDETVNCSEIKVTVHMA